MTFVNFSLLAGTALVALPIVLHLIMRRRPRLMEFPALRFVKNQHDANRRRMRLRHLLLLLLRCCAIALLAAALARPSMKLGGVLGSQEAPVAAAMVFDAAPRMEYRHNNETRLQAAQKLGKWLIAQLPPHSDIAVLDTRLAAATAFQVDRSAAAERIKRLLPVAKSQPLTVALEGALRLLDQSNLARKEVYVFTDLARAAWPVGSADALRDLLAAVPGAGIYLIDVGVEDPTNYALGELRLSGGVLSKGSPLSVATELHRTGPEGTRTVEMYLQDDKGTEQKRSEDSYTLGPGESRQVDFRIGSLGIGVHQGFVRIVGADGLEADDVRYFTVDVRQAWRVLVAAPKPAQRHALFLTEALAPAGFRRRGQARFDCSIIKLDELPDRSLAGYSAVCLLNPTPLRAAVWRKLGDFASDGGGVAIFLGRNAAKIKSFNSPQAQELLPGKLLRQARRPSGDLYLAPRDYQHTVLSAFRSVGSEVPWLGFPVFRYWELEKPTGTIVSFSDGRPAMLERSLGAGRVLTMTTPISDDVNRKPWNLLPAGESWPFVILVNQMMSYLVGSSDEQLNYFAGQTAVLKLDADSQRRNYLLSTPDGLKFPLSADLKRHVLVITSTDRAGNYRVQAGGRASGVDRGFSVNLAPEQTEMQRTDKTELAKVLGQSSYRIARTRSQLERDVSTGRVGRELFGMLILMVAMILALEHVVANQFYKK